MEIQSISSSTNVYLQSILKQTDLNAASSTKKSGASSGAKSSSASSESSSSTTYDVRDTNKDGIVSSQEKMAYILKLIEENRDKQTENGYNQLGQYSTESGSVQSTFLVNA